MAGSGRRVFAPGEVLTASNTMNYLMDQTVMNFAGTAARGSAIGTAVAEGMVSYLADTNDVEVYDGSAWSGLAYKSFSGLVPIAPSSVDRSGGTATANSLGQVTFSAVTSLSLNGVFSSAYNKYKLVYSLTFSSAGQNLLLRFRASGTDASAANTYFGASWRHRTDNNTLANLGVTNTEITLSGGSSFSTNLSGETTISDINVSGTKTMLIGQHNILETNTLNYMNIHSAQTQGTASYDGITLYPSGGNITGLISVYGFND
jgi:hypothetical protein